MIKALESANSAASNQSAAAKTRADEAYEAGQQAMRKTAYCCLNQAAAAIQQAQAANAQAQEAAELGERLHESEARSIALQEELER